ncbi:hypothetical protein HMPREF9570_01786 [Cutibacterium acnes HL043PA1]|nr:hypothetical protein HMPREF9570_01786 [Cutibacterium acnes HL043PA1]
MSFRGGGYCPSLVILATRISCNAISRRRAAITSPRPRWGPSSRRHWHPITDASKRIRQHHGHAGASRPARAYSASIRSRSNEAFQAMTTRSATTSSSRGRTWVNVGAVARSSGLMWWTVRASAQIGAPWGPGLWAGVR